MTALSLMSLLTGGLVAARSERGSATASLHLERIGGALLTTGFLLFGASLYAAMN